MAALRLLFLALHLMRGLLTCALVFPLIDKKAKQGHIRRWSRALLTICQVDLRIEHKHGAADAPRALIVANHISWLDVFVINALHPCRFVAKSDIRGWPLIGWLCEQTGVIFIARGKLRDVRRIYQGLVASLQDGEHVAFFPEGTTAAQGDLLPFHSNLFEAAIEAGAPVQPYALRYLDRDGSFHPDIDYVGPTTIVQSVLKILNGPPITAELALLAPIPTARHAHRRELAAASRAAIAEALRLDATALPQEAAGR